MRHLPACSPLHSTISNNEIKILGTDYGLPLGLVDRPYFESNIEFNNGNKLLLYSDGVTEAMNSKNEEYGQERIISHLKQTDSSMQTLLEDVRSFTDGHPASDDITILTITS